MSNLGLKEIKNCALAKTKPLPTEAALVKEFTTDSAIHPDLFSLNGQIIFDVEQDELGDLTTPIHDALGWKFTRFTNQARQQIAVKITDHEGEIYQLKVYNDRPVKQGKSGTYYAIKGSGDLAFRAKVPKWLCGKIAKKYGLRPPTPDNFWQWVQDNPKVELIITEGVKKALALLSHGYVAISLYGCRCGYDKATKLVSPAILPYALKRAKVTLAFDSDSKDTARKAVFAGLSVLSPALKRSGAKVVDVATWNPKDGKGVDDLLTKDPSLFEQALETSLPFKAIAGKEAYKKIKERQSLAKYNPFVFTSQYFPSIELNSDAQIIGIKGPKGVGKTQAILKAIEAAQSRGQRCYVIVHRQKLAKELCDRLGISHLDDLRLSDENGKVLKDANGKILGYGLCIDSCRVSSAANFRASEMRDALVLIDEADQVIDHLLLGGTLSKGNRRPEVLDTLQKGFRQCLGSLEGKIILLSADLSPREIDFIASFGDNPKIQCIENLYNPVKENPRDLYLYNSPEELIADLHKAIARGENILAHLSAQKEEYKYSTSNLEKIFREKDPDLRILRIDSDTISDPSHAAYGITSNPERLAEYDLVLASSTIETGISIDLKRHFDAVFCLDSGVQTLNGVCQSIERLRDNVPRHIYLEERAHQKIGDGSTRPDRLLQSQIDRQNVENSFRDACQIDVLRQSIENLAPIYVKTWAEIAAERNLEALYRKEIVLNKLEDYGYRISCVLATEEAQDEAAVVKEETKASCEAAYKAKCQRVAKLSNPTDAEYKELDKAKDLTKPERESLLKGQICRLYLLEGAQVTPELVREHEKEDLYKILELRYYLGKGKDFLLEKEKEKVEKKIYNGMIFLPDIPVGIALTKALEKILPPLLEVGKVWDKENLRKEWAEIYIYPFRKELNLITGITINPHTDSVVALAQKFLRLIGSSFSGKKEGGRSGRRRTYALPPEDPEGTTGNHEDILDRWLARDTKKLESKAVGTTPYIDINNKVVPTIEDKVVPTIDKLLASLESKAVGTTPYIDINNEVVPTIEDKVVPTIEDKVVPTIEDKVVPTKNNEEKNPLQPEFVRAGDILIGTWNKHIVTVEAVIRKENKWIVQGYFTNLKTRVEVEYPLEDLARYGENTKTPVVVL